MDEDKRMIPNHEVKIAIPIGGKEVIPAEDLTSGEVQRLQAQRAERGVTDNIEESEKSYAG